MYLIHHHLKHPSLKIITHIIIHVTTTPLLHHPSPMPDLIGRMITIHQIQVPLMGMEEVSNHNHLHHQRITCLKHICLVYSYLNKEVTIYVHHHIAMTRLGEKV